MEGASALVFRQPPPNRQLFPKKFLPMAIPSAGFLAIKRALPILARAEPVEGRSAEISSPPLPASSSDEIPAVGKGSGAGFGGVANLGKKKGKQKRGAVIRREPVQKPSSMYTRTEGSGGGSSADQSVNESAFLLTWLGLGLLILAEGLALASSGFLPESVDQFISKYVYPVFTPTIFFFVAGSVAYGVFKYLQGDSQKS